jgi:hypothetical protein
LSEVSIAHRLISNSGDREHCQSRSHIAHSCKMRL